ncbi:hypothetical protein CI109_101807 [Kwoniella shandongensis]|uniref:Uncharacterized protein n=1 Tax=Kwoniella shandongensis TaxID=1734106 RepID=A0A5M6C647_9TREE|nr:uncharacterized protein CI109_001071 [Kwoniella shandongensis]KAA5530271.1 hypothetical protein CI109_001071 [Kwoniella shandongensis]
MLRSLSTPTTLLRQRTIPLRKNVFHLSQQRLNSSSSTPFPFKPPPIRQRLRPLIPFFIYWTIITSLAVHLLRLRISSQEELDKRKAQISVLSDLVEKLARGDDAEDDTVQRELEMVGLRERTALTRTVDDELRDTADVRWYEVLFGKKRSVSLSAEEDREKEEKAIEEWAQVINEATKTPSSPPDTASSKPKLPERPIAQARRAPSSNVYLG